MSSSSSPRLYVVRKHFASLPSTNAHARELAAARQLSPDALTVVTADEQTAGRGRLGRSWASSRDDIKATFAFRVPRHAMPQAYQLSPLMAVVACRAVARHGGGASCHGVAPRIKWPNDVIVGGARKAGGILCELESDPGGEGAWAALGLGLNVNSLPEALGVERAVWPLSTLRAEAKAGFVWDVAALLDELCAEMREALHVFFWAGDAASAAPFSGGGGGGGGGGAAGGSFGGVGSLFSPFQAEYEQLSVLLGRVIRFADGGRLVQGRAVRIGADGRLFIQEAAAGGGGGAGPAPEPRGFLSGEVAGGEIVDEASGAVTLVEGAAADATRTSDAAAT
jgi:biotin-(acetyl-CoA carboxylase) ligase